MPWVPTLAELGAVLIEPCIVDKLQREALLHMDGAGSFSSYIVKDHPGVDARYCEMVIFLCIDQNSVFNFL